MGESKEIPSAYDLNAKWDAYLDLGVRRFVYSSATGALAGLILFREFFMHFQTLISHLHFNSLIISNLCIACWITNNLNSLTIDGTHFILLLVEQEI